MTVIYVNKRLIHMQYWYNAISYINNMVSVSKWVCDGRGAAIHITDVGIDMVTAYGNRANFSITVNQLATNKILYPYNWVFLQEIQYRIAPFYIGPFFLHLLQGTWGPGKSKK
jgi:hypothetical protein